MYHLLSVNKQFCLAISLISIMCNFNIQSCAKIAVEETFGELDPLDEDLLDVIIGSGEPALSGSPDKDFSSFLTDSDEKIGNNPTVLDEVISWESSSLINLGSTNGPEAIKSLIEKFANSRDLLSEKKIILDEGKSKALTEVIKKELVIHLKSPNIAIILAYLGE